MHCQWHECGCTVKPSMCEHSGHDTRAPSVTMRQPRTLVCQPSTKTWASTVQRRNGAVRRVGVALVVLEWMQLPAMA